MRADDLLSRLRRIAKERGEELREREGRGAHVVVRLSGLQTSISMHRGDMPQGTYQGILKALGLKPKDVER